MEKEFSVTGELELFILFTELDRLIYLLGSRFNNGIIPKATGKHIQALLKELNKKRAGALDQLPKYGVNPIKTEEVLVTIEFQNWYRKWDKKLKEIPESERSDILRLKD